MSHRRYPTDESPPHTSAARANERRVAALLFILLLALYLLSASLRIDSGDGEKMYQVSYSLVTGQGSAIPVEPLTSDFFGPWGELQPVEVLKGGDGYGMWGIDGRYYAKYGLGWSLAAAPLCALGRVVATLLPQVTEGFATRVAVMLLNPLLTAASGVLLFKLARRFYPTYLATTLALLYGLCTIAWYYAESAFSEPLVTLLLLAAITSIERGHPTMAGIALGGTVLARQMALLLAVPVAVWALVHARRDGTGRRIRCASQLLVPLALGQMAVFIYNVSRFGNPLEYGYWGVGWDTPLLLGLYSQLLSPGKGLFVFMPVLLLGILGWPLLWRKQRDWAWLFLALVAFHLVPYALYEDWAGGGGWGPRLLLPIVPILLLPAGEVIQRWQVQRVGRLVMLLLIALSLFVQVLGVSVNWARHLQRVLDESASSVTYFYRVHYRWVDSPILGQARSLQETLAILRDPDSRATLLAMVDAAQASPLCDRQSKAVERLSSNVPDFWFVYLWFLGLSAAWLIGAALILVSAAAVASLQLQQALAEGQLRV